MRTLAITVILLGFLGVDNTAVPKALSLSDAADAAIGSPPQRTRFADHYGDPDGFIKYIIRKPPVLA